jgi:starvation-inducible outer membrane lipoprotein
MNLRFVLMIGLGLALAACSPAPPRVEGNPTAQQTPTPAKQKAPQLNNTGWAP